jgi:hypothetical protein
MLDGFEGKYFFEKNSKFRTKRNKNLRIRENFGGFFESRARFFANFPFQVLNPRDFKRVLKWRVVMRDFALGDEKEEEEKEEEKIELTEEQQQNLLQQELDDKVRRVFKFL